VTQSLPTKGWTGHANCSNLLITLLHETQLYGFWELKAPEDENGSGDKIKIDRIFNKQVIIHDYWNIRPSRCFLKRENGKCLYYASGSG
jgi:hypothetical protein